MPVAEVVPVRRGTAISAVYGTVRIEPAFVVRVRAQNAGFIKLAETFSTGRGAIGMNVEKGQLLATIADETTALQLKQARADLDAAVQRAALPLPSSELLKAAEDNLQRLQRVVSSGNVPAVEFEKAKSEANRLRGAVEAERIEQDRNLNSLEDATKKLEAQMKNSEVRAPIDGLLTNVQTIDGELVSDGNELFTVSSIQPAADPETQRYTIVLQLDQAPDNLMAGMTGEMNIIVGKHENVLLVPARALLVDQALIVKHGVVQKRTVKVGFRTLDFSEIMSGLSLGDHVVVADQDRLHPGKAVRQRVIRPPKEENAK